MNKCKFKSIVDNMNLEQDKDIYILNSKKH